MHACMQMNASHADEMNEAEGLVTDLQLGLASSSALAKDLQNQVCRLGIEGNIPMSHRRHTFVTRTSSRM